MIARWVAIAFIDLLLLLVACVVLLAHPTWKQAASRPVADFSIFVVWDVGRDTDVDIYIKGPDGRVAWYNNKNIGYVSIDRDDLGSIGDSGAMNQEIVAFRSPPSGSYFITIHNFREVSSAPGRIAMELADRDGVKLWQKALPIPAAREEVPIVELVFHDGRLAQSWPSTLLIRHEARGEAHP